eukprot:Gb_28280 [translate_table: standard]
MVGVGRSNDRVTKRDDGLERPWYGERFGELESSTTSGTYGQNNGYEWPQLPAQGALDAESERVVQEALDRIMINRTIVIVAHRLNTIRNADMISIIQHGSIMESGQSFFQYSYFLEDYKDASRLRSRNSSLRQSISSGSSGVGSSHHSYSFSFALPSGGDMEDGQANHGKDVSLFRLASLNKLEFPFFILGSVAAAINGVTFPIFVVGGRLMRHIRSLTFEKVVHQEIGWFDENEKSSGVISERLSANDATVHRMLALLILALVPMLGLQGWVLVRFIRGFSADEKVMDEEASQVANDVIRSIRTVASFCVEDKYMPSAFGWGLVWLKMGRQLLVFFALTMAALGVSQSTSLALDASKTVALVGESGSGKSTVISLLERFCDPNSGHVLLDGVKNFKLNAVVEASNAHKFISGLPQGYNTNVGERWVQLSGGQKQRISISRAILKDPRILLLDEATSALDAESKCIVQDALDRVMVDRSTIVVAHHLSTIKDVDLIAVVKNGVIIEQGKHEEFLSNRDGTYASLVKLHMFSS